MANVAGGEGWRCDNFAEVKEEVEAALGINIELTLIQDSPDWGDYKNEFVLASEAGQAPDIVLSGHEDIGAWAPAGYIIPLDDMIPNHPEFADVVPTLWESQTFNGQIWGIPQDAEARPVFYSKLLLADLGWTEEEIESLPERVASGEFTFEDMIATAQQAIEEGVIEPGNGFWHRPSNGPDFLYYYYGQGGQILDEDGNLMVDRAALLDVYQLLSELTTSNVTRSDLIGIDWTTEWHPLVAGAETVLFAASGTWNWADWARNYVADRGGNDYLLENIGLTLIPAMKTGTPLTLTHPLSYMISSSSEHPEVAMALLAAVTTPQANNRHAIDSFHLGILNTQLESPEYIENEAVSMAHYMLDYATSLPNHPGWNAWSNAYWLGIQAVEAGDATPEEAVEIMVTQLQNELPEIVVR
ncbi:MAG TPA: extracellular solute-binding protein [Spirillospora sp.]|nr:extracellular solute-binding protein [Spirillospora sp.]